MKDLFKKNKKAFYIGGVIALGGLAWYLFRTKSIEYYDNVWCGADNNDCGDIDPATYPSGSRGANEGNDTGNLNLLFKKPHGLKEGEDIYIQQNGTPTYPYYNGKAMVTRIVTPYIVATNKARQGDSPVEGGVVLTKSIASKYF